MGFYEFTQEENVIFTGLFQRMIVGGSLMVLAGLALLLYVLIRMAAVDMSIGMVLNIANGLFLVGMGYLTFRTSKRYKKIVDTQGHDVMYLMEAMVDTRRLYTLISALIISVAVLAVISLPLIGTGPAD